MSYEPGHKSVFSECECYYGDFWVGGGFSELSHQAQHPLGVELMLNLLPPSPCSVTDLRQQWDSPPPPDRMSHDCLPQAPSSRQGLGAPKLRSLPSGKPPPEGGAHCWALGLAQPRVEPFGG